MERPVVGPALPVSISAGDSNRNRIGGRRIGQPWLLSLALLACLLFCTQEFASARTESHQQRFVRQRRAATARLDRLWDEAVIPYEIDPGFGDDRSSLFRAAMRHWENYTCVKFVERSPDQHKNYIVFTERSCGCCSFVGKRGNGAQAISIGKHCDKFGIVVHELGHVVGFWHEHTRPDRDQHVQIIGKNIMQGQEYNFNRLTKEEVNSLGLAYDYDSILHYATNTFAKDTYLDTILPLHGHLNTEEATSTSPTLQTATPSPLMPQTRTFPPLNPFEHRQTSNSDSLATGTVNQNKKPSQNQTKDVSDRPDGPGMANEEDAEKKFIQVQQDFQSMLQFQPASKQASTSPKIMLIDGDLFVAVQAKTKREKKQTPERSERLIRDATSKLDVDDGQHMLAMDNMLAKTRPEIGQRVRLSVGDIAQTNLLYRCPKCGRTIQQTSGQFQSPNYYSNYRLDGATSRHENPRSDGGMTAHPADACEWRLSVGQGERIMINFTDLDLAPPVAIAPVNRKPQGLTLPVNINNRQDLLMDTPGAGEGQQTMGDFAGKQPINDPMVMHNCLLDYVEVRDGYTSRAPLIAKLCGHISALRDIMRPLVSTGNRLLVTYKATSPSSIGKRGFQAQHETVCGGYIMLGNAQLNEPLYMAYNSQNPSLSSWSSSSVPSINTHKTDGISAATTTFSGTSLTSMLGIIGQSSTAATTIATSTSTSTDKAGPSTTSGSIDSLLPTTGASSSSIVSGSSVSSIPAAASINTRVIINSSSPSENEVPLSSQTNQLRYNHLQSQQPFLMPFNLSNLMEPTMTRVRSNHESSQSTLTNSSSPVDSDTSAHFQHAPERPSLLSESQASQADAISKSSFGWSHWPSLNTNIIQSPNWPEQYRASKECVWQIRADEHHQISLRFDSFDLESHDSCAYDYVEVRDGDTMDSELIGRFCGNRIPEQILSSSQSLMVKFISDSDINRGGFLAVLQPELDECKLGTHGCSYKCSNAALPYRCECPSGLELAPDGKNCVPTCGGLRNESAGLINSPSFPDLYPVNTKCIWEIIAPPHHRITLNFTHFDLEGIKAQECDYDYVDIRSRLEDGKYLKNGIYCGPNQSLVVESATNILRVEFNSDNSIQKSGFLANYFIDKDECATNNGGCQHICTNTIGSYQCSCNNGFVLHENRHGCVEGHCTYTVSVPEGTFNSPNFPNPYSPNKECAWVFLTAPGHRIKLNFDQFDIEGHQECAYDHVAAYDGESTDDPVLGRFCGSRRPLTLVSSFNMLYLLFQSDATNERRGFNASHSAVCGGRLQTNLNQNDLIYSHSTFDGTTLYNRNEDCEWIIEANYNQRVRIEFVLFALEADANCNYDQTIVYDGADDTAVQLARLCGTEIPKEQSRLTSSGESMLIVFKSDDSINNRGFSLTYTAIELGEDETIAITNPTGKKYTTAQSA